MSHTKITGNSSVFCLQYDKGLMNSVTWTRNLVLVLKNYSKLYYFTCISYVFISIGNKRYKAPIKKACEDTIGRKSMQVSVYNGTFFVTATFLIDKIMI